jgi:hypothetical protein
MSLGVYISNMSHRTFINTRTCMIVSKLNAVPFHRVNSPLVEPVSRRLPSGVHFTTLTGWRILFKDECKCLAGTESTALPLRAGGKSIYESGQHFAFHCTFYLSRGRAQTHVYHVTSTGSFHLESHGSFVLRSAIMHELCHVCAVIGSRAWLACQCLDNICDSTGPEESVEVSNTYVVRVWSSY